MRRVGVLTGGQGKDLGTGTIVLGVLGSLLAQNMPKNFSRGTSSSHLLLVTWLVYAFIVGTAYRGNLTASLTAPHYPPRVETLRQLVDAQARSVLVPVRSVLHQAGIDCQVHLLIINHLVTFAFKLFLHC